MKTLLRRFAAALSLASLALSWPLAFVSAQTQTARRILIIGDSQSVNLMSSGGLGQKLSASGITVVGRYTKVCWGVESMLTGVPTVANANCNTGGPVSDFLSQNSGTYDAVVVFLGGNDCASTRPCAANYGSKIDQLIALLQPKSTNIIWFGPTYYESPDKHVQSRTFMNSYMPSRVTHYYDLWDLTTSITKPPGDVHFDRRDPGGYPRFGELVAPIIASFINGTPVAPVTSASTDSGTPPPTADVLGRSPEEVQAQLAAQCADRDPVFPVRLGVGIGGTTEVNGLTEYINVVYRYMTAIVLVVAIVMVTYGGFRYLLAASPIGVKDGKDIIKNAIVGMVLVLSAYVILNTINPATTVLQFTRPPEDIVCRNFEANLLRAGGNSGNLFSSRGESPGLAYYRNQFDPLGLRNRSLGTECTAGGVEVDSLCSGNDPECVDADHFLEAVNNIDDADTIREDANYCSDGTALYSLCEDMSDCKNGMICDDTPPLNGIGVCVLKQGNAEGSPCHTGITGTCTSAGCAISALSALGVGEDFYTCAAGLECRKREHNAPNANIFNPTGLEVCTKVSSALQHGEIAAFNNGIADPFRTCHAHRECGTGDNEARCSGSPLIEGKLRACLSAPANLNGTPCGKVWEDSNGATVRTYPCDGNNGFTCAFCPNTGTRVWTSIRGQEPNFIGQCKPNSAAENGIGANCAGN